MRGKVERVYFAPQDLRITPAYAGKRSMFVDNFEWGGDHPRLCGEKVSLVKVGMLPLGSPPPMRGKVL